MGHFFTFEKYKTVKKDGKVSKSTRSVDFIDQSVDTFLDTFLKMDTNLCPKQERPAARAKKVLKSEKHPTSLYRDDIRSHAKKKTQEKNAAGDYNRTSSYSFSLS